MSAVRDFLQDDGLDSLCFQCIHWSSNPTRFLTIDQTHQQPSPHRQNILVFPSRSSYKKMNSLSVGGRKVTREGIVGLGRAAREEKGEVVVAPQETGK